MNFSIRDYLPHIIVGFYVLFAAVIGFLNIDSNNNVLSSVISINFFGTAKLDSSQLDAIFGDKLFSISFVITLLTLATVIYVEVSDPSYGSTRKIIEELRISLMTPALILGILFILVVFFKIWSI